MLDSDLAELCQVETRRLNEQVKRILSQFPIDFMFQLAETEWNDLMSQNAHQVPSVGDRASKFEIVFTYLNELLTPAPVSSRIIGFKRRDE
jgi:hypothetical protein